MNVRKVSFFIVALSFFLMSCASAELNDQDGHSDQALKQGLGLCEDLDDNFDLNRLYSQASALIESYAHSFAGACLGFAAGTLVGPQIMPYIGRYLEYMPLGVFDVIRFMLFAFMHDNYLKRFAAALFGAFVLIHIPKLLLALVDNTKEYCIEKAKSSVKKPDFIVGSSYAVAMLGFSSILVWAFLKMLHNPFFMQATPEVHVFQLPHIDPRLAAAAAA